MDRGMYIAASGSLKQERMMDTVANNLANVNTDGFKKDLIAFEAVPRDFNDPNPLPPDAPTHPRGYNAPVDLYPTVSKLQVDFSPGHQKVTGNPLDVALEGRGFFEVSTPEGIRYQRSGNFKTNDKGDLLTSAGYQVMGKGGPITGLRPGMKISINESGGISMGTGLNINPVDYLKIVDFPDYDVLDKNGEGLFMEKGREATVIPAENVMVVQGSLEAANVNVASELVKMIEVTRAYESYQKVIQSIDALNNKAVNEISKV